MNMAKKYDGLPFVRSNGELDPRVIERINKLTDAEQQEYYKDLEALDSMLSYMKLTGHKITETTVFGQLIQAEMDGKELGGGIIYEQKGYVSNRQRQQQSFFYSATNLDYQPFRAIFVNDGIEPGINHGFIIACVMHIGFARLVRLLSFQDMFYPQQISFNPLYSWNGILHTELAKQLFTFNPRNLYETLPSKCQDTVSAPPINFITNGIYDDIHRLLIQFYQFDQESENINMSKFNFLGHARNPSGHVATYQAVYALLNKFYIGDFNPEKRSKWVTSFEEFRKLFIPNQSPISPSSKTTTFQTWWFGERTAVALRSKLETPFYLTENKEYTLLRLLHEEPSPFQWEQDEFSKPLLYLWTLGLSFHLRLFRCLFFGHNFQNDRHMSIRQRLLNEANRPTDENNIGIRFHQCLFPHANHQVTCQESSLLHPDHEPEALLCGEYWSEVYDYSQNNSLNDTVLYAIKLILQFMLNQLSDPGQLERFQRELGVLQVEQDYRRNNNGYILSSFNHLDNVIKLCQNQGIKEDIDYKIECLNDNTCYFKDGEQPLELIAYLINGTDSFEECLDAINRAIYFPDNESEVLKSYGEFLEDIEGLKAFSKIFDVGHRYFCQEHFQLGHLLKWLPELNDVGEEKFNEIKNDVLSQWRYFLYTYYSVFNQSQSGIELPYLSDEPKWSDKDHDCLSRMMAPLATVLLTPYQSDDNPIHLSTETDEAAGQTISELNCLIDWLKHPHWWHKLPRGVGELTDNAHENEAAYQPYVQLLEKLRRELQYRCEGESEQAVAYFKAAIALAEFMPIYEEDIIMFTPIDLCEQVNLSNGAKHSINTIMMWSSSANDNEGTLLDPVTREPFSAANVQHILDAYERLPEDDKPNLPEDIEEDPERQIYANRTHIVYPMQQQEINQLSAECSLPPINNNDNNVNDDNVSEDSDESFYRPPSA